jgi:murein DD-endopeptidase MepM/ murein hydrolase activator NlpD
MSIRPAGVAVVAVAALAVGLSAPARAEPDLATQREQVDQSIEQLRQELSETSQQLFAAAVAMRKAEAELPGARAVADQARRGLATAHAKDRQATAKLAVAESAERRAERELAAVNERIATRKENVGRIANQVYREGGLSQLAMLFEAESPEDFAAGMAAVQSIAETENSLLRDLAGDQAELARGEERLAAVRERAAQARVEAGKQLAGTRIVERRTRDAERRVSRLVRDRRTAYTALAREKAGEQRRIALLERERSAISAELAARAAAARAQAASTGESGSGGDTEGLSRPVSGPVTSPYGMRVHPITGVYKLHDGTDFGGSCGTPIHAAAAGLVIWAKYRTGYGYQIAVDHGVVNGVNLVTSYSHLPAGGFAASSGARVDRGQVVGYIGASGYATGCHLHFMTYEDGATVDPMRWL